MNNKELNENFCRELENWNKEEKEFFDRKKERETQAKENHRRKIQAINIELKEAY